MGPWRGEVGFEALYWLPFLAAFRHAFHIPKERIIPISRGGAAIWYDAPRGVELLAMRTPQELRVENRIQQQQTGLLKQMAVSPFDRQVIRDAADSLGLSRYLTIHPSWMYQTLADFWDGRTGLAWLQEQMRFAALPALQLNGVTLPEKFVAVRFYHRSTFRRTPMAQEFVTHCIRRIAQTQPVVILNNPAVIDDHTDVFPRGEKNVTILSDLVQLTPENNLAIQSAVLSKALGFVGTYGGMAQLALRLGKPSISVYDEWQGTALPHRHLSDALALHLNVAFNVIRIGDLPVLQSVLPTVLTNS